jgi:hypothetical protein
MKAKSVCAGGVVLLVAVVASLFLTSCAFPSSMGTSGRYDAGNNDIDFSSSSDEFRDYSLFLFDTTSQSHTLTTSSAEDMVDSVRSPEVGQVLTFAVSADGDYAVTVAGGAGVTVKTSASTVAANSTLTIYCVFDSITSGEEEVTFY